MLAGAYNFRDLGGLRTEVGRTVRTGTLFRSDTLQALTGDDVALVVDSLGVELIVDLRAGAEAVAEGRGLLAEVAVCYLNAPLRDAPVSDADPRDQALNFYRHTLDTSGALLATVVKTVAALGGRPAIVHCAAGKDRTGLVTALLLSLLDVNPADIVADYLATEPNMPRIVERFRTWPHYREHMTQVPPEVYLAEEHTIRGFLHTLDRNHGGAIGWAHAHGIRDATIYQLRDSLLTPR